jgi:hypothetical protein
LPRDEKRAHFAKRQEACRKDVECCFGVLQGRFSIISNPCWQWNMDTIADVMFVCYILHNMILEDECYIPRLEDILPGVYTRESCRGLSFEDLVTNTVEMENEDTHFDMREDLIEHLWAMKGANTWA